MSDAQYVIDIAAEMPAGEATTAQLDEMVKGLTGAGKGADFFQVAMKQLSGSLDAAKAAAKAANGALAEGNASYRELEKAANVAAKAVEKAGAKGVIDPKLSADSARADAALKSYAITLKSLEQNAAAATKAESTFATQLANVQKLSAHTDKTVTGAAEATEKLRFGLSSVPGPVGKIGSSLLAPVQGFQKLTASMGSSNAAMLLTATAAIGAVVAVVAITAAVIAGAIAIASWAVGLADAGRSAGLVTEATEILHPELEALHETVDGLTDATGLTENALDKIALSLKGAHVAAADLPDALRAAALAEAALGQGGAQEFIAQMQASKKGVRAFSQEISGQLEGVVAKKLRGLDGQAATFKKNIGQLFGELDIEPVLKGLERLGGLFDQNTAAGQTIKFLFETVFQPLINQAEKASIVVEAFALGFLIGMTKLYIGLKPVIKGVEEFFGFKDTSLADVLAVATKAGEYAAAIFAGVVFAFLAVAAAIGAVVAIGVALTASLVAMVGAVIGAAVAVGGAFLDAFTAVKTYLAGLPDTLVSVGRDLMLGLANGITGGVSSVVGAMTGAVGSAIDAAKHKLGIASPSKVFAEIGGYTGEGFAQGVDDSAPDAQAAMTSMVNPAPAAAQAGASAPAAGGSSGPTVHIEKLYLAGAEASKADTISLSEALTRLIRGDAAALGGGEAAPA